MSSGLELTNIKVARARRLILDGVSVHAGYGSVLAILGPNGAGKSTLLETIAGFHAFDGDATIDGVSLRGLGRADRARQLAYVPQVSRLDSPMIVRDVVAQGRFAHHGALGRLGDQDRDAIERALSDTDTQRLAERVFTRLSAGERRRVLLARALATGAKTLLLDEPSASLDIAQALALLQLIRDLASAGHAIIVVLHHLDEAVRCADRAVLLEDGKLAASGAIADVVAAEPVRRVYGVELIENGGLGYRRVESGR